MLGYNTVSFSVIGKRIYLKILLVFQIDKFHDRKFYRLFCLDNSFYNYDPADII